MLIKENTEFKTLMVEQSKETNDFKNLILEIVKKDTYQNTIHNNNSHNKTFNLQFFLHLFSFETPIIIYIYIYNKWQEKKGLV